MPAEHLINALVPSGIVSFFNLCTGSEQLLDNRHKVDAWVAVPD
jgi:hypothetical protein